MFLQLPKKIALFCVLSYRLSVDYGSVTDVESFGWNVRQLPRGEFKQNETLKGWMRPSRTVQGTELCSSSGGLAFTCLLLFAFLPRTFWSCLCITWPPLGLLPLLHQQHGSWWERWSCAYMMSQISLLEVRPLNDSSLTSPLYFSSYLRTGFLPIQFIFIQAAKLANYAKYQRLCDTLFVIFSAVFVVTRLGILSILVSVREIGHQFREQTPRFPNPKYCSAFCLT